MYILAMNIRIHIIPCLTPPKVLFRRQQDRHPSGRFGGWATTLLGTLHTYDFRRDVKRCEKSPLSKDVKKNPMPQKFLLNVYVSRLSRSYRLRGFGRRFWLPFQTRQICEQRRSYSETFGTLHVLCGQAPLGRHGEFFIFVPWVTAIKIF